MGMLRLVICKSPTAAMVLSREDRQAFFQCKLARAQHPLIEFDVGGIIDFTPLAICADGADRDCFGGQQSAQ